MAEEKKAEPKKTLTEVIEKSAPVVAERATLRRQIALAVVTGFVTRHGGLGTELEREANARMIWSFADAILETENAGPWVSPAETEGANLPAAPRKRAVAPNDEWGVHDGRRMRRFAVEAEAEEFAALSPGRRVVQLDGPEVQASRLIADPTVTA